MPQLVGNSLGVVRLTTPVPGIGARQSGDFPVNAVTFDGTNDFLEREGQLTGAADGENILISFWFNLNNASGDSTIMYFLDANNNTVMVRRLGDNTIQIKLLNPSVTKIYEQETTNLFSSSDNIGWHHLLFAAQLDVTPVAQTYIDSAVETMVGAPTATNGDIDFTPSTDWGVGASGNSGDRLFGDLSEVYMAAEYLDISIESNREKFIDSSGFPVDLGSDGSTPTGTAPLIYFSGATVSWHTNDGSGGGFTEGGALTDAATSPSD